MHKIAWQTWLSDRVLVKNLTGLDLTESESPPEPGNFNFGSDVVDVLNNRILTLPPPTKYSKNG